MGASSSDMGLGTIGIRISGPGRVSQCLGTARSRSIWPVTFFENSRGDDLSGFPLHLLLRIPDVARSSRFPVRYGRIGTDGQVRRKTFKDAAAARRGGAKAIDGKLRKGYEETRVEQGA